MSKWITVIHLNTIHQANLIKSKLESQSILCFIKDENMSTIYNYQAGPSIEVKVVDKDYAEAKRLLIELGYLSKETKKPTSFIDQNKLLLIAFGIILIACILYMLAIA